MSETFYLCYHGHRAREVSTEQRHADIYAPNISFFNPLYDLNRLNVKFFGYSPSNEDESFAAKCYISDHFDSLRSLDGLLFVYNSPDLIPSSAPALMHFTKHYLLKPVYLVSRDERHSPWITGYVNEQFPTFEAFAKELNERNTV